MSEETEHETVVTPEVIQARNLGGKPKARIDWDEVKLLLANWSSGPDLAEYYAISRHTLYTRCQQDLGMPFSELQAQCRSKTKNQLRMRQIKEAHGHEYQTTEKEYKIDEKGKRILIKETVKTHRVPANTAMLIWLGKNLLGQSDAPEGGSAFGNVPAYRMIGDGEDGDEEDKEKGGYAELPSGGEEDHRFEEDDPADLEDDDDE